jgi:hypothetical protein
MKLGQRDTALLCLKVPSIRPLVLQIIFNIKISVERWWNDIGREKHNYSGQNLFQCNFFHHKSHMDRPQQ